MYGFTVEFYLTFKDKLTTICLIKQIGKEYYQTYSIKPVLPWYQNSKDTPKKRKLQNNFPNEHYHKNSQQNNCKLNSTTHLEDHTVWSSQLYSRDARMVQHRQINTHNISHKQNKEKNCMTISIDAKNVWQNSTFLYAKTPNKLGIEGTHLNVLGYLWSTYSQHHTKW
jgi:hypothetical protein